MANGTHQGNGNTLQTPDVTIMQKLVIAIGSVISALMVVINAFEITTITDKQAGAVMGLWIAFSSVLLIADAVIRHGRSRALAAPPQATAVDEEGKKVVQA